MFVTWRLMSNIMKSVLKCHIRLESPLFSRLKDFGHVDEYLTDKLS